MQLLSIKSGNSLNAMTNCNFLQHSHFTMERMLNNGNICYYTSRHISTNIPLPRLHVPSGIGYGMDVGKGDGVADMVVGSGHKQLKEQ